MKNEKIIEQLKSLKSIEPRPEWIALNRDLLMSQIKSEQDYKFSWKDYTQALGSMFRQRLLEPTLVMLLLLGFSVGSSLVVNASFYSLPGESLYKVKIALETAQIAITPDEQRKAELQFEFAQKRVIEFDKIVAQTNVSSDIKNDRLNTAVKELQKNVASVQQHIAKTNNAQNQASDSDREKTLRIAVSISNDAKELVRSLDETSKNLSENETQEVKEIVEKVAESAHAVSESVEEIIESEALDSSSTSTDKIVDESTASTTDDIVEN